MNNTQQNQRSLRSRNLLRLTEIPRAGAEIAALVATSPWLGLAPRGEQHPVLVIPGFGADDNSTRVLRQFLTLLGYDVYAWAQGRNMGAANMGGYHALITRVLTIYRETQQKVSLIGWSLGGVHALTVADRAGYAVRQLVALGSPINIPGMGDPLQRISAPITTIYSRSDGIVPWQRSQLNPAPSRDNIEVYSSHIGLGFNPAVLYAVADRLALAEGGFTPFNRNGWRALTYPAPKQVALHN